VDFESLFAEFNPEDAPADIRPQLETAIRLLQKASIMDEQGPYAETPMAILFKEEAVSSTLLSVMMSPLHSDVQKVRLITALVIISLQEFEISVR